MVLLWFFGQYTKLERDSCTFIKENQRKTVVFRIDLTKET